MSDRYGQILIKVSENEYGHIFLSPASKRRAREISRSNLYDGSPCVYIQDQHDVEQFKLDFPRAMYLPFCGERKINSGVKILIDSWTYRHMVGGQSD